MKPGSNNWIFNENESVKQPGQYSENLRKFPKTPQEYIYVLHSYSSVPSHPFPPSLNISAQAEASRIWKKRNFKKNDIANFIDWKDVSITKQETRKANFIKTRSFPLDLEASFEHENKVISSLLKSSKERTDDFYLLCSSLEISLEHFFHLQYVRKNSFHRTLFNVPQDDMSFRFIRDSLRKFPLPAVQDSPQTACNRNFKSFSQIAFERKGKIQKDDLAWRRYWSRNEL